MPGSAAVVSSRRRGDEERALLERLNRGDPGAQAAIVRRFLALAHKFAHGWRRGVGLAGEAKCETAAITRAAGDARVLEVAQDGVAVGALQIAASDSARCAACSLVDSSPSTVVISSRLLIAFGLAKEPTSSPRQPPDTAVTWAPRTTTCDRVRPATRRRTGGEGHGGDAVLSIAFGGPVVREPPM